MMLLLCFPFHQDALDWRQLRLASPLVPKLLDLARCVPGAAQTLSLDLYFDMLRREYSQSGAFKNIERYTIDYLYHLANGSQAAGNEFTDYLTKHVEMKLAEQQQQQQSSQGSDVASLQSAGLSLIAEVKQLYSLMCALLKFPDTALYEDERTAVALHLMDYLEKQVGRLTIP